MSTLAQPIGIREILDAPVQLIRQHFALLIRIALVGEAIAAIPVVVFQVISGGDPPDLTAPWEIGRFMGLTYGAVGSQWLVRILPTLALFAATRRLLDGESPSVGGAYAEVLSARCYFSYALRGLLIGAGSLLCLLPGAAAAFLLALLGPVIVHEGLGWGAALRRAYDLVWYNPSRRFLGSTLSAVMTAGLVFMALSMALNTMAALPGTAWTITEVFATAARGASPTALTPPAWLVVVGAVLGVMSQAVVDLYPAAVFTLIYREARRRREGEDLAEAIQARLGGEPLE